MSKNVKFKVEKRSYPKNSAIVDIDVDVAKTWYLSGSVVGEPR